MKNLKTFGLLVILGCFQALGVVGQELVIEREAKVEKAEGWKRVEGTDLFTAVFEVPPDFMGRRSSNIPGDPFGGQQTLTPRIGIKGILAKAGVPFPDGSRASFDPIRSEIEVTNTIENLEMIEVYVDSGSGDPFPAMVACRVEIYEIASIRALQLQESAEAEKDHKPERDAVLRLVREGGAKLVATKSVVVTETQRAKADSAPSMLMPDFKEGVDGGKERFERSLGTVLEVEPDLEGDGYTITLNVVLEHHTADPEFVSVGGEEDMPVFHRKSVSTNIHLYSGGYVLLATWKPTGKPEYEDGDLTQVVFVTVSVQEDGE